MIKFNAVIVGMDDVCIVIDEKMNKPNLLKHLQFGGRRSEKFLIDNIESYFSVIMNGKTYEGSDKKGREYKVSITKL